MPLYEYRCAKCGGKFEVIQKFADAPVTTHENCGGTVERLVSVSGLHFKGSGFYVNDYARSGGKDKGKADGSTEAKPAGESKSDSKPETKSESKPAPAPSPAKSD